MEIILCVVSLLIALKLFQINNVRWEIMPRDPIVDEILKNPEYRKRLFYSKDGKIDFFAKIDGKIYRIYNKRN